MQTELANEVFRFGGFTLDLRKGVLQRQDDAALLRPKAQAVITHLARNMGRVIPKSELMDIAWPGVYVTEDSLTQSIREIRKALGDDKQELVRTISRRGYMLAAAAEPVAEVGTQPIVAVLRFRNETGDGSQVPLVDGFAEDIINGLARFRTVTVLARNSSFAIASDAPQDWALARARIGADYLVEGTVRRADGRIRVSVSLIDAASLAQLWGERYDAESADIFAIMDDIVARILGTLVTRLDDVGASRARHKPEAALAAYDRVLRGVALMRGNSPVDFGAARGFFEAALAKDPAYGLAYAYLAFTRVMIAGFGRSPQKELAEVLPIAMRAVTLSPDLPTSYRVVSFIRMYQREYASAEHHLRRALELPYPCDPESVAQMGYLLTLAAGPAEALGWMDRAQRLSPIHPPWYDLDRSFALDCLGDYRGAATQIELTPVLPAWMQTWLAACYAQMGDLEAARLHAAKITETDPGFSALKFAKDNGAAFEHASDNQHFAEGVYLAIGTEAARRS